MAAYAYGSSPLNWGQPVKNAIFGPLFLKVHCRFQKWIIIRNRIRCAQNKPFLLLSGKFPRAEESGYSKDFYSTTHYKIWTFLRNDKQIVAEFQLSQYIFAATCYGSFCDNQNPDWHILFFTPMRTIPNAKSEWDLPHSVRIFKSNVFSIASGKIQTAQQRSVFCYRKRIMIQCIRSQLHWNTCPFGYNKWRKLWKTIKTQNTILAITNLQGARTLFHVLYARNEPT